MTGDHRRSVGRLGERIAERELERSGCRVIDRNFRTRRGELDLIAVGPSSLVFCEVKTRVAWTGAASPVALDAIGPGKRRRLRGLAAAWLRARPAGSGRPARDHLRFDAIGVVMAPDGRVLAVHHVEDAF